MSTHVGRRAESVAASFLRRKGFYIMARNWRTRWCEIDIVARLGTRIHFVEVKYRRSTAWGRGTEYITPQKLRHMYFAADMWTASERQAYDYRLSVVELTGEPPVVTAWLDDLV